MTDILNAGTPREILFTTNAAATLAGVVREVLMAPTALTLSGVAREVLLLTPPVVATAGQTAVTINTG